MWTPSLAIGPKTLLHSSTCLCHSEPEPYEPEDDLTAFFEQAGIDIFDAGAMTVGLRALETRLNATHPSAHVFWDHVHFLAPVYAGLNNVLLNYICED